VGVAVVALVGMGRTTWGVGWTRAIFLGGGAARIDEVPLTA